MNRELARVLKKASFDDVLDYYRMRLGNAAQISKQYGNLDDEKHYVKLKKQLSTVQREHRAHMGEVLENVRTELAKEQS